MKKLFLLMSLMLTMMPLMAVPGESLLDPLPFDWVDGNEQEAGTTVFYEVDLKQSGMVEGDNVLLYMNNLTDVEAEVTVQAYLRNGTELTDGPTTKVLSPRRNAAMELSNTMISFLGEKKIVYVKLTANQKINFAAEPVEPGEKDLDCLSATAFDWAGTTHNAGAHWYKVDLSGVADDETVVLTLKNQGAATATLTGHVSMDCPSTGVMSRTLTIGAGDESIITLKRSYLNMVAADEVYVKLESDQKILFSAKTEKVAPEDLQPEITAPATAIEFALDTDYPVAAGVETWYKVKVPDLNVARQLPEITIENEGAGDASIEGKLLYTSPSKDYVSGTLYVAKGDVYVKEVPRNFIEAAAEKSDVVYICIKPTEDITFSVRLKGRTEGTACLKAKPFDKAGTYQAGSADVTWYAIDITAEKADATNDLQITVENRSGATATVAAQIAFDCPCETTTDMTRTIGAGATTSKTLLYSMYANLATDTIWVGVTTDQNIMMSAQPVAAEAFTPIDACKDAKEFKLDTEYLQAVGEGWYVADLNEMLAGVDAYKVPELAITNNGAATATVKVEIAYECPVTYAMQSRTITIAAGATYTKKPTIDMLNSIDPSLEKVYIRITTDQALTAIATLEYENEGASCATATAFDWVNGNDHAANDTAWYAIDLTEAKTHGGVKISVENLADATASIYAEISMSCPVEGAIESYSLNLGAHAKQSKELPVAGVADVIYIRLGANQNLHLSAEYVDMVAEEEDKEACLAAQEVIWNHDYTHTATDTIWYKGGLEDLRNGHNVPHLFLTNTDSKTIRVTAEVTFDCAQATTSKTLTFSAGQEWDKLMEQNFLDGITADSVYVKLYGDGDFTFRVETTDPNQGQDCLHAIPFDWKNGNIHIEGDSLWYVIELADTMLIETERDLRIEVKNLDTTKPVNANFTIVTDCKGAEEDILLNNETATLAAGETTARTISNDIVRPYAQIKIGLKTDADVHIKAEFVSTIRQEFFATRNIYGEVCMADPAGYTYTIDTLTLNHFVTEDRATWTWTDTVTFDYSKIELADSIVTFNIIPIQIPTVFFTDKATLAAPVVTEGKAIDLTATTADLLAKYAAAREAIAEPYRDTIAEVTEIAWQIRNEKGKYEDITNTRVAFGTEEVDLSYYFTTDCGDESKNSAAIFFDVEKGLYVPQTPVVETICAGIEVTLASGKKLTIAADTTVYDSIFVAQPTAEQDKMDVYQYDYTVWKDLVLPTGLAAQIHPQAGLPLDISAADAALKTDLDAQVAAAADVVRYTSATWEILQADNTFGAIPTAAIADDVTSISLRFAVETTCKTQYSDTMVIAVTSVKKERVNIADTLCVGDDFISRLGTQAITADITFTDSIRVYPSTTEVVDSFYVYDLKVWRELNLPDVSAQVTPQVGVKLDITAADAALRADLDAQNAADALVVAYTDITWAWLNPATNAYEALPTTQLAQAENITLQYTVATTCGDVTSAAMVCPLAAKTTGERTITATVCAETIYDTFEGDVTIHGDTTFTQIVEYNIADILVDSLYHYDIKVWRELNLPDVSAQVTPQVGVKLDITAADAAVRADLDAQNAADALVVAYTDITWAWLNPETNAYEALPTTHLAQAENITLQYTVTTTCGDVTSAAMVCPLAVKTSGERTITDRVCAETIYNTFEGDVTIHGDTTFTQIVEYNIEDILVDSLYHYDIKVFVPVTLPASLTELPQAICGQPLHTDKATEALKAILDASVTEANSTIEGIRWEILAEGAWADATTFDSVPALSEADITVRYIVTTSCAVDGELISNEITLVVETPTADNTETYANMPAVSKYDGWLLMINLNEINARGFYPTEDQVAWMKIVGEADFATTDAADDEQVGTGYYYTSDEQLTGKYYAVIDMAPVAEDPCGAIIRTVTITCATAPANVSIAPNMVAPGEDIVISGLNPTATYTLDIYNLMGILVESRQITGTETYSLKAQDVTGYYMLNVQNAAEATTLRYIVK